MIIQGFKEIPLNNGCFGLEMVTVNVGLDIALKNHLTSVNFVDSEDKRKITKWWVAEMAFKTTNGECKSFTGAIIFPSHDALIQLLIDDYLPKEETILSSLLQDARNNNNISTIRQINRLLFETNDFGGINPFNGKLMSILFPACNVEIVRQNKLEQININGENYYLQNSLHLSSYFYYTESKEKYGKHNIPRRKFLLFLDNSFQLFWDGNFFKKMDMVMPAKEELAFAVGDTFVKELSDNGKAGTGWLDDPYLREYFEPAVLVRVPSANKISKNALIKAKDISPPPNLDIPLFIQDTRTAVKLPQNLPVIEDQDSVMHFLSRIRNGSYIPNDSPLPPKLIEDKEYYLVGSKLNSLYEI